MEKLKMLDKGPNGNYRKGQIVEVDDQRAAELVAGKHAVKVGEEAADGDTERI